MATVGNKELSVLANVMRIQASPMRVQLKIHVTACRQNMLLTTRAFYFRQTYPALNVSPYQTLVLHHQRCVIRR